jgi:hypothetical protein
MSNNEDAWIALLNDLTLSDQLQKPRVSGTKKESHSDFNNDIFFNDDGEPTDRFLEAIKADLKRFPEFSKASGEEEEEEGFQDDYEDFTEARPQYPDHFVHRQPSETVPKKVSKPQKGIFIDDVEESPHVSRNFRSKKNISAGRSPASSSSVLFNEESTIPFSTVPARKRSNAKSVSKSPSDNGTSNRAVLKEKLSLDKKNVANVSSKDISSSLMNVSTFIDTNHEIENDSKVKSLQLRIKGQLQCIKSLELQLQNATELLSLRNKQIGQFQAKLKSLSEIYGQQQSLSFQQQQKIYEDSRFQDIIDQYKKQLEIVQNKLQDEISKRHRSEERWKMLKEYAEKSKTRCSELEIHNAELKGLNAELTSKMDKYRKSYRESGRHEFLCLR